MFESIFAICIGLVAGVCSGLFGIGGGIIIVPAVVFLFKFTQQGATATSLVALLLPVGALGVWQYYQKGYLNQSNVKIGLLIALGLFVGALIGARIASDLNSETLKKMFAVLLFLVAAKMWWS